MQILEEVLLITDRKSTSGSIILIGTDPIYWSSKKQSTVATSTMEAKYIGTTESTKKDLSIINIMMELFNYKQSIKIYTDNLSSKKDNRKRTNKHIIKTC